MITDIYPDILATLLLFVGLWLLSPVVPWHRGAARLSLAVLFVLINGRYILWRFQTTLVPIQLTAEAIWTWTFAVIEL